MIPTMLLFRSRALGLGLVSVHRVVNFRLGLVGAGLGTADGVARHVFGVCVVERESSFVLRCSLR